MTLFIREKLQEVFMATGTTMMLVSHDLEEAVYLADEVLLLTKRPTRVAEILHVRRSAAPNHRDAVYAHVHRDPQAFDGNFPARSPALIAHRTNSTPRAWP